DGGVAHPRPGGVARVPRPRGGPAGPAQRRHVAGRRPSGDIWTQAAGPGWLRRSAGPVYPGRAGTMPPLRAETAEAGPPPRRLTAVPPGGVRRVAGHPLSHDLRHVGRLFLHLPVPGAGTRAVAAWCGAVGGTVLRRVHSRFHTSLAF